jgi:membrane protein YqaA with SNARE-associated domain
MAGKKKKEQKKKTAGSGKGMIRFVLILLIIMSAVFLPTAFLLMIGLLPTVVAFFVDTDKRKTRFMTVGAVNLAGCSPFLMDLWTTGHTMSRSLSIILDPMAVVVIYAAAVVGYMIDWGMGTLVAGFLYERGKSRKTAIEKQQAEMIERWGKEVTGTLPLDEQGFPVE